MKKSLFIILFLVSSLFSSELFKTGNKLVADGKGVMFIFESDSCPYCTLLKKRFQRE